jgi:exodeoxyribonuclease VII large subunit
MADKVYTISEVTKEIKILLEQSFGKIWVEGEISNYIKHSSGHRYFTLKDQGAQIKCVMWRWTSGHLFFEPQDGMKVKASGQITIYEKSGQYQLVVTALQPTGIGELELAFQQLKKKLADEGLFDPTHKISIPSYPRRIGVVTSPTGAAIRDILNITKKRAPSIEIILWPVAVQGDVAAEQIAHAIAQFNKLDLIDLLIIGRGGGSLEDLWAFNEEIVARAIFDSELPIISAVGHEIDFSIADFVADLRAPTPTAAAEIAVRATAELPERLMGYLENISSVMFRVIEENKSRIGDISSRYGLKRPLEIITRRAQRTDELSRLLNLHMVHRMGTMKNRSRAIFEKLEIVSPRAVLERGFSYTRDSNGVAIKSFKQVAVDDKLEIIFYEGGVESRVSRIKPDILKNVSGSNRSNKDGSV